ncbi:MAG: hypothetical protein AVDCRST_MAG48-3328, partial [uncultured Friedmanniella sp.]
RQAPRGGQAAAPRRGLRGAPRAVRRLPAALATGRPAGARRRLL